MKKRSKGSAENESKQAARAFWKELIQALTD